MYTIGLACLLVGLCATATFAQSTGEPSEKDKALYKQFSAGGDAALAATNQVLKHAETISAPLLYSASGNAYKANRLEDAAFLFYVAQMRARFDVDAFPPVGQGGNSPITLLSALSQNIGHTVNPAIMAQPAVFKHVLARVQAWEPQIPKGYSPGWEHTPLVTTGVPQANQKQRLKETLHAMSGLATLLSDPEYFKNFRLVQTYNGVAAGPKPSEAAFKAAVARLTSIEKEKKIPGPFTNH